MKNSAKKNQVHWICCCCYIYYYMQSDLFLFVCVWHGQIFTNGKYKSVLHRAVVKKVARISIGIANSPAMNVTVRPAASPLIQNERFPPLYFPTKYSEYVEMQQTNPLDGKSCLDRIKIISPSLK